MENTSYVIQGLTLSTESLVLPKIVSRYLPVNFDTISRATLLFEDLRFLVSAWDTFVHWWLKLVFWKYLIQRMDETWTLLKGFSSIGGSNAMGLLNFNQPVLEDREVQGTYVYPDWVTCVKVRKLINLRLTHVLIF